MKHDYSFINYRMEMNIPDGIYNGRYNKEPAVIRIKEHRPVYVQFIEKSAIYDPAGILLSSVELLLPKQEIETTVIPTAYSN